MASPVSNQLFWFCKTKSSSCSKEEEGRASDLGTARGGMLEPLSAQASGHLRELPEDTAHLSVWTLVR